MESDVTRGPSSSVGIGELLNKTKRKQNVGSDLLSYRPTSTGPDSIPSPFRSRGVWGPRYLWDISRPVVRQTSNETTSKRHVQRTCWTRREGTRDLGDGWLQRSLSGQERIHSFPVKSYGLPSPIDPDPEIRRVEEVLSGVRVVPTTRNKYK